MLLGGQLAVVNVNTILLSNLSLSLLLGYTRRTNLLFPNMHYIILEPNTANEKT